MISLGRDTLSLGQTKRYGFDLDALPLPYLTDPNGNTLTISANTGSGINCTVSSVTNSGGVVYFSVAAAAGLAAGARGAAQITATLSNGEVVPLQLDLDFA